MPGGLCPDKNCTQGLRIVRDIACKPVATGLQTRFSNRVQSAFKGACPSRLQAASRPAAALLAQLVSSPAGPSVAGKLAMLWPVGIRLPLLSGCGGRRNCIDSALNVCTSGRPFMENVILIIHLLLALSLIGVVLIQKSEGGGLGMGGGGGGTVTGRPPASALGKVTWMLAIAFIGTSITLTILAAQSATGISVLDRITDAPARSPVMDPTVPADGGLLPPPVDDGQPLLPRAD